ncbi:MAG: hypothetical protein QOG16_283, partial [Actinomycetota bacterium]|nr:hypothetical protein [Actinomycetota bacterium]
VVALDQATGRMLWQSKPYDEGPKGSTNASTLYFDGLVFVGYSESGYEIGGSDSPDKFRGGWAIIDAATGKILVARDVIPNEPKNKGMGGGGIWATGAVDPKTKFVFVGTGNPYGTKEHKYTNAILKIDLDRSRPTFGEIVDYTHGDIDQYDAALGPLGETPLCENSPLPATLDHPECGQIDLDVAAAPNLFTDSEGRQMIGSLQKSGNYHAVYTDTMELAWSAAVGAPCALCNADATAYDGEKIYAVGAPGGVLVAINKNDGSIAWRSPVADGTHYEAISVANGVVYTIDTKGNLDTFDAETGAPDFSRPMEMDSGSACSSLSGGVAIAQSMVFAPCGGILIAYS